MVRPGTGSTGALRMRFKSACPAGASPCRGPERSCPAGYGQTNAGETREAKACRSGSRDQAGRFSSSFSGMVGSSRCDRGRRGRQARESVGYLQRLFRSDRKRPSGSTKSIASRQCFVGFVHGCNVPICSLSRAGKFSRVWPRVPASARFDRENCPYREATRQPLPSVATGGFRSFSRQMPCRGDFGSMAQALHQSRKATNHVHPRSICRSPLSGRARRPPQLARAVFGFAMLRESNRSESRQSGCTNSGSRTAVRADQRTGCWPMPRRVRDQGATPIAIPIPIIASDRMIVRTSIVSQAGMRFAGRVMARALCGPRYASDGRKWL
jgi:hypothetical protein